MLPREFRLGSAAAFAAVIKAGRRAGTRSVVVHASIDGESDSPRAGFVVSGKVGNSVVRHRVTRRLRPLVRLELAKLAPGTEIVVRALPAAANATSADLGADLRTGLTSALRKARSAAPRATSTGQSLHGAASTYGTPADLGARGNSARGSGAGPRPVMAPRARTATKGDSA